MPPSATQLLLGLKETLSSELPHFDLVIAEFGQVAACERRERGEKFSLSDHISGLVKALLSNRRQWKHIQSRMTEIESIFLQFDPVRLKSTDPSVIVNKIRELKLGNISIDKQIKALRENIETFEELSRDFGSIDNYLNTTDIDSVIKSLASGKYKLKQVGPALAYEYLRHVGIRVAKPDTHIRRVMGNARLAYIDHPFPPESDVIKIIDDLSAELSINPSYLDTLLWLFCADGYGNVCGAKPRCSVCQLQQYCNKII